MKKTGRTGITLIEVIIAMWILFIAISFIFEVLRTSYTYVTRMKAMSRLATLTTTKLERILYLNGFTETTGTEYSFPEDQSYKYTLTSSYAPVMGSFPNYQVQQVTIAARGPVDRISIPENYLKLSTVLLDVNQEVKSTAESDWGEGLSPEAEVR